jgi:hypothetical protein
MNLLQFEVGISNDLASLFTSQPLISADNNFTDARQRR